MTLRERLEESQTDRRLLLLVIVLLLVLLGSGIGTFLFDSPTPAPGNTTTPSANDTATPLPTPVAGGPANATATPTPDAGTPRTATSTDDTTAETPTEDDDRDDDDQRDDERDDDDDRSSTPSPGLELEDDQPLFSTQGIVPGQSGQGNLTVRNTAGEDGWLSISDMDADDEENGITDAESSVDNTSKDGELSDHLKVRFAIHDGGNEEYLVGNDTEYVGLENASEISSSEYPLGSGDEATLVAEWKLPTQTGNEVQSDGVSVDVELTLESTNP